METRYHWESLIINRPLWPGPQRAIEVLAVAEQAEGAGVGRALMDAVEQSRRDFGLKALTLNVFLNNQKARGFYRHLGYEEELLSSIKDL